MINDFDKFVEANPELDEHEAFAKFLGQKEWSGSMSEVIELDEDSNVSFSDLKAMVYRLNKSKGWYDSVRSFGEDCALLHSEVSEALEAYRDGLVSSTDEKGKPLGVGSELADVLIRLLDTSNRYGINLMHEFSRKMEYNWTRPERHGGKKL